MWKKDFGKFTCDLKFRDCILLGRLKIFKIRTSMESSLFKPLLALLFQTEKFFLWRKLISCAKIFVIAKICAKFLGVEKLRRNCAKSAYIIKESRLTCQLCSILMINWLRHQLNWTWPPDQTHNYLQKFSTFLLKILWWKESFMHKIKLFNLITIYRWIIYQELKTSSEAVIWAITFSCLQ